MREEYAYNRNGQRVRGRSGGQSWACKYDGAGRLLESGQETFGYDARGALARRNSMYGGALYQYGVDTRLDSVRFLNGGVVRYGYGGPDSRNPLGPREKFRNDRLIAEYAWRNPLQLSGFRDYESGLEYRFFYKENGGLHRVELTDAVQGAAAKRPRTAAEALYPDMPNQKSSSALHRLFGPDAGGKVILFAGCDQVGTPKIFVRAGKNSMEGGTLCKKVFYDSFGNAQHDSEPQFFMPIGFAGGLYDRDTGLVRFGYRDYDPKTGRFTAPDPAKDLRGDGDLYDYCVDDPVSRVDPTGLWTENQTRAANNRQGQAPEQAGRPQGQQWNREQAVETLRRNANSSSQGQCASYVRRAIEAGGINLNRDLNSTDTGSASGYGPILENGGFRAMDSNAIPQAGDVAVFPPVEGHPHGHTVMYDGERWISDFNQRDIYAGPRYRNQRAPYILYRRSN